MKDMGYVIGSEAQAKELIIGLDTVYVHSDIQKIKETLPNGEEFEMYKYYEVQYTKQEYAELVMINQPTQLDRIEEVLNIKNKDIANSAVDAYTLELIEKGVL